MPLAWPIVAHASISDHILACDTVALQAIRRPAAGLANPAVAICDLLGVAQDADGVGQQNPIPLHLSLLVQDR